MIDYSPPFAFRFYLTTDFTVYLLQKEARSSGGKGRAELFTTISCATTSSVQGLLRERAFPPRTALRSPSRLLKRRHMRRLFPPRLSIRIYSGKCKILCADATRMPHANTFFGGYELFARGALFRRHGDCSSPTKMR